MSEKEAEIPSRFTHRLPGEHVYEGILFFGYSPPDVLDAVKEFEVRDDDVFLATYPKAGKCMRGSRKIIQRGSKFDNFF